MVAEGLERSIVNKDRDEQNSRNAMSKDEQIGFHKGSISTLIAERNELLKVVGVTEQLINAHAAELSKLGVNMVPSDKNQNTQ